MLSSGTFFFDVEFEIPNRIINICRGDRTKIKRRIDPFIQFFMLFNIIHDCLNFIKVFAVVDNSFHKQIYIRNQQRYSKPFRSFFMPVIPISQIGMGYF